MTCSDSYRGKLVTKNVIVRIQGPLAAKSLAVWTRDLKQKYRGPEPLQVQLRGPIANFPFFKMLIAYWVMHLIVTISISINTNYICRCLNSLNGSWCCVFLCFYTPFLSYLLCSQHAHQLFVLLTAYILVLFFFFVYSWLFQCFAPLALDYSCQLCSKFLWDFKLDNSPGK